MAEEETLPIELEYIRSAVALDIIVTQTQSSPTGADDVWMRIDGRLGAADDDDAADDVEWGAMPFLYAVSTLSFADARPRGISDKYFKEQDDWTAVDLLRGLTFVRGELSFAADYVRGRCVKTELQVRKDGTFTLTTTNRGEAATRWIGRLQGKKPLAAVSPQP